MKTKNAYFTVALIIIAIGLLIYASYETGYKKSKNEMGSLLMTMSMDSSFVTAGLYEELPNDLRRTMHFYIEDTPTIVNDVKIYAEVKYMTIGKEVISVKNGKIWDYIKREKVFQRKFNTDKTEKNKIVPNSPFALLESLQIK